MNKTKEVQTKSTPAATEADFAKRTKRIDADFFIKGEVNGLQVEMTVNLRGTPEAVGHQLGEITRQLQARQGQALSEPEL